MEMNPVYRDSDGQALGMTPPETSELTEEEWGKMSAEERKAYAREFKKSHDKPRSPVTPVEVSLTKEDRLEAENLQMHIKLTILEREAFVQDAVKKVKEFDHQLIELRERVSDLQKHFQVKYSIDFTKQQIEAGTGRIIPAP